MERNLVLSDFANTPGELFNGYWKFPVVETANNNTGKTRVWQMLVGASMPIEPAWITGQVNELPANLTAFYYTISGQVGGKMTQSANKSVTIGKVKRNIVQQALSEATNLWRKQRAKSASEFLKPQLLQELDEDTLKSVAKKFGQPIWYVSYKYNGVRCMACMKDEKVVIYSRSGKEYDLSHLAEVLTPIFEEYPDIVLDGELYFHGMAQSDISGLVRSGKDTKFTAEEKLMRDNLIYHVFDIIDRSNLCQSFTERYKQLINIIKPSRFYVPVDAVILPNTSTMSAEQFIATATELMRSANTLGLEGIVLRVGQGGYEESINSYHSINVLKKKPVLSYEFRIIGYDDGKGKNEGAIQWICQVPENLREKGGEPGKQFNVVPKGTYEDKKQLFARFQADPDLFKNHYLGRLITIEFAEWSDYGLPVQIRAVNIRDIADL